MIKVVRPAVAMSIQDQGRIGYRHLGVCRSGAMDDVSLRVANSIAGAAEGAAGIELGPGPCEIEFTKEGTVAMGGALREGAAWWKAFEVVPGQRMLLSGPVDGVWSYLSVAGGIEAQIVMGSRSTSVREGIGRWLDNGDDELGAALEVAAPKTPEIPALRGPVRTFGQVPGAWSVSTRMDRMGYQLEGEPLDAGTPTAWSEPIGVGAIQLTGSGLPFVMMSEGSTAGGYPVLGYVHPEDLRLLAQTPPGERVAFNPV